MAIIPYREGLSYRSQPVGKEHEQKLQELRGREKRMESQLRGLEERETRMVRTIIALAQELGPGKTIKGN